MAGLVSSGFWVSVRLEYMAGWTALKGQFRVGACACCSQIKSIIGSGVGLLVAGSRFWVRVRLEYRENGLPVAGLSM